MRGERDAGVSDKPAEPMRAERDELAASALSQLIDRDDREGADVPARYQ